MNREFQIELLIAHLDVAISGNPTSLECNHNSIQSSTEVSTEMKILGLLYCQIVFRRTLVGFKHSQLFVFVGFALANIVLLLAHIFVEGAREPVSYIAGLIRYR